MIIPSAAQIIARLLQESVAESIPLPVADELASMAKNMLEGKIISAYEGPLYVSVQLGGNPEDDDDYPYELECKIYLGNQKLGSLTARQGRATLSELQEAVRDVVRNTFYGEDGIGASLTDMVKRNDLTPELRNAIIGMLDADMFPESVCPELHVQATRKLGWENESPATLASML